MIRAAFGGFDGGFKSRRTGQHDHFGVGPGFFNLRQKIETVRIGQIQIEQDDIRGFGGEKFFQRRAVFGLGDGVIAFQNGLEQQAQIRLVVHNENFTFHDFFYFFRTQATTNTSKIRRCAA